MKLSEVKKPVAPKERGYTFKIWYYFANDPRKNPYATHITVPTQDEMEAEEKFMDENPDKVVCNIG